MLELHIVKLFLSLKTKTSHSVNTFLTSRPYESHFFFSDFLDFKVILLIYLRLLPVKIHIPLKSEKKDILSVYPDTLFAEKFFRLPFAVNFNFHFIRKKNKRREMVTSGMTHYVKKKNTREREFLYSQLLT